MNQNNRTTAVDPVVPCGPNTRLSSLAASAALIGSLNPVLGFYLLSCFHLVTRGFGFLGVASSLVAAIYGLSAGIVSLHRIKKSGELLRGRSLAIIGIVGGALWILFWLALVVLLVLAILTLRGPE
jgi:hypothetical protein